MRIQWTDGARGVNRFGQPVGGGEDGGPDVAEHLRARYSDREGAYILPDSKKEQFRTLMDGKSE